MLRWVLSSTSIPSLSKNRRTTDCGSSGTRRTVMPAMLDDDVIWNLVTGTVAASRSSTLMPAALQPTMIARFNTRAALLVSLDEVTLAPFSKVDAQAMDRRTANSGLMSTLASPCTPSRPNRDRAPRDSQTIDELTMAPASTVLKGEVLTPPLISAWAPPKPPSPSTPPPSHRHP